MDANRFESLLRSFSVAPSRREAVRLLGGFAIGLLGWSGVAQTMAHNAIHECTGIKNRKKRQRCKEHAHKHNARHAGADPAPPPSVPPAPTCMDGVKNGSESDVDCGGSCPRCANDLKCASQDDCASALCVSGVCKTCSLDSDSDCGIDSAGPCICRTNQSMQQPACMSSTPVPEVGGCDACADDEFCDRITLGGYNCRPPCGAV
jgi:hypothetical protein